MKIYVGNLNFRSTEEEIQALFASYGQVEDVTLITDKETGRPRGFGFVIMTEDDAGRRAIDELNGKEFDGRALTVNEARPREPRRSSRAGVAARPTTERPRSPGPGPFACPLPSTSPGNPRPRCVLTCDPRLRPSLRRSAMTARCPPSAPARLFACRAPTRLVVLCRWRARARRRRFPGPARARRRPVLRQLADVHGPAVQPPRPRPADDPGRDRHVVGARPRTHAAASRA